MNKPVHQHFIPRSYLNNFAKKEGDKRFIGAKDKNADDIKTVSTRDICVEKNLYTIPETQNENKFAIEHFYADNVDAKFPEIYELLTDKGITDIDLATKTNIISVVLSLYFRTPKFLNQENKILEELVRAAHKQSKGGDFIIEYAGEEITIYPEEVEQIIKEKKENNRIKFLSQHLSAYEAFVRSKLKDGISVYHIVDDSEFITSDNPVIIRPYTDPTDKNFNPDEYNNKDINPFDKRNTIHVPIDSKTLLTILPNFDNYPDFKIRRLDKTKYDTLMYNHDVERYAERWILGSAEIIASHVKDQIEFDKPTPQNMVMLEDYKEKTIQLKELYELISERGIQDAYVIEKAKYMETLKSVKEDTNFLRIFEQIKLANKEKYS